MTPVRSSTVNAIASGILASGKASGKDPATNPTMELHGEVREEGPPLVGRANEAGKSVKLRQ